MERPKIISVDGRCAAGKSTLAAILAQSFPITVIHLDDYFLRPEQRTPERLAEPGGNVDRERFLEEVLLPLHAGKTELQLRKFDCGTMELQPSHPVACGPVVLIEGSYSCHPDLYGFSDFHVFLDVDPQTQLERIARRSPERLEAFKSRWIPMEENYFDTFSVKEKCDLCLRL